MKIFINIKNRLLVVKDISLMKFGKITEDKYGEKTEGYFY